jgi:signal transduction histidine kinase
LAKRPERRQTVWQIALLTAGFAILFAIAATSIYLVNSTRSKATGVLHTIEVENQISRVMLNVRTAESAARGYLLTQNQQFLDEYERTSDDVIPAIDLLASLTSDNPAQVQNADNFRIAAATRVKELQMSVNFVKESDIGAAINLIQNGNQAVTRARFNEIGTQMQREEERLFALRSSEADNSTFLFATITLAGVSLVALLGTLSVLLLRQRSKERDVAEQNLRDANLNLEATVDERTSDLREANEEVQRFAYIVSHDLRSPLVNIMGFTSELEDLRLSIFNRIVRLEKTSPDSHQDLSADDLSALPLNSEDRKLAEDFSEALRFIKSSIAKMDRLIGAILHLTREGRREFKPENIDMRELIQNISSTVAHQTLEAEARIKIEAMPTIVSDRLALEQIFSNLIDNALKYLRHGIPGEIVVRGRNKLGFAVFEISDNGRGIDPKDHQRIFDLFRRAGFQDRPGQGIGLAHVRALVRRMGGSMSVNSQLNEGSTFIVTLPNKPKQGR